jgi:Bacterial CdiA-CT RNAse A domain
VQKGPTRKNSDQPSDERLRSNLKANTAQVRAWASAANNLKPLVLDFDAGSNVGYGVVRLTGALTDMQGVRIVLRVTDLLTNSETVKRKACR